MVILLMHSSAAVSNRLAEELESLSAVSSVIRVARGTEAVAVLKSVSVQLVFLDIRIGGENGLTLIRVLKSTAPGVKVCLLANYPYRQYYERAIANGADYFLPNPSQTQLLRGIVDDVNSRKIKV